MGGCETCDEGTLGKCQHQTGVLAPQVHFNVKVQLDEWKTGADPGGGARGPGGRPPFQKV